MGLAVDDIWLGRHHCLVNRPELETLTKVLCGCHPGRVVYSPPLVNKSPRSRSRLKEQLFSDTIRLYRRL